MAIETPIGWSLFKPSLSPSSETNCQVNFVRKFNDKVEQLVSNLWDTDFQSSTSVLTTPQSSEDRVAHEKLKSFIGITSDGHYQLPLLWKDQDIHLPNNTTMAKQRLHCKNFG